MPIRTQFSHSNIDKIFEAFALFFLALAVILVAVNYASLPDTIPTHFDLLGKADRFGAKSQLLLLLLIPGVLYAGLSVLMRYPRFYNFPVAVTDANRDFLYRWARTLLRMVKMQITLLFTLIILLVIRTANAQEPGLIFPAILSVAAFTALSPFYFVAKMYKTP